MLDEADEEPACAVCGDEIEVQPNGASTVRSVGRGTPVCSDRCERQLRTAELPRDPPEDRR